MKRITLNEVEIQLTRRCQIKCKHCFRGEAENKDITPEVIDAWLNQTEMIGLLHLTGGEPTLNLDMMEYLVKSLRKHGTLLMKLSLETNGYEKSERFIDILKEYAEVIKICHSFDLKKPRTQDTITIAVSNDEYHKAEGCNPEEAYKYYKEKLNGIASVFYQKDGLIPVAVGRGKNLNTTVKNPYKLAPKRIEILDKNHVPMCQYYKSYQLTYPEQIKICCAIGITTGGGVYSPDNIFGEFSEIDDNVFCTVDDDIYKGICEYNKGKITCLNRIKADMKQDTTYNSMVSFLDTLIEDDNIIDSMDAITDNNSFDEDKPSNITDYKPNVLDSFIEHEKMGDIEDSIKSHFLRKVANNE